MERHTKESIERIKNLRHQGETIPEIMRVTGLSKSTVWHHAHKVILTKKQKDTIDANRGGSNKRYEIALNQASKISKELLVSSSRESIVAIAMLYWAEGSKREFVFTNTDQLMIKMYLNFLTDILHIDKNNISLLIRIADPIKESNAKRYWKTCTNLHASQIKVNHNNVQNMTKTKYGICRVSVKKSSCYLKIIQCIIGDVQKDMLP